MSRNHIRTLSVSQSMSAIVCANTEANLFATPFLLLASPESVILPSSPTQSIIIKWCLNLPHKVFSYFHYKFDLKLTLLVSLSLILSGNTNNRKGVANKLASVLAQTMADMD
jgi:hypothetical protein